MRVRTLFGLWLPLAVSFELMMLEGPALQGAIGRLPHTKLNLAAWGLTMSLSLLIESPVIMLLATTIALAKDADAYRALRRFMLTLSGVATALTAIIAFTPLFDLVAGRWMKQPAPIVAAARPALQIMLLWTAAIAWRRFYQGVLVRHGQTRMVSRGTAIRLATAVTAALALTFWGRLPGVQVGAVAIMSGVLIEALATTRFALPVVRRDLATPAVAEGPALTQRAILRFHTPLAATTLLMLLAQPMTLAVLGRLKASSATHETWLAVWPVVFTLLLVMRGWGLALQEITVAQGRDRAAWPALRRFTLLVGIVTSGITALIALTPLLDLYLSRVLNLHAELLPEAHTGVVVGLMLPFLTALGSWARGLLVASGVTNAVYRGMGINLIAQGMLLTLGVLFQLPGMALAAGAFTLAAVIEYAYLARRVAALHADPSPAPESLPVSLETSEADVPRRVSIETTDTAPAQQLRAVSDETT